MVSFVCYNFQKKVGKKHQKKTWLKRLLQSVKAYEQQLWQQTEVSVTLSTFVKHYLKKKTTLLCGFFDLSNDTV